MGTDILDKILPRFKGTREEMLASLQKELSKNHWPAIQAQRDSCTMCPKFGQQCMKNALASVFEGGPGCGITRIR